MCDSFLGLFQRTKHAFRFGLQRTSRATAYSFGMYLKIARNLLHSPHSNTQTSLLVTQTAVLCGNFATIVNYHSLLFPCSNSIYHFRSRIIPCTFPFQRDSRGNMGIPNSHCRCRPLLGSRIPNAAVEQLNTVDCFSKSDRVEVWTGAVRDRIPPPTKICSGSGLRIRIIPKI